MALQERIAPQELIFHSDRGSLYTSKALRSWLKRHGLTASTSTDNASAESAFSRLKFALRDVCAASTREEAISHIESYVVEFYNTMRRYNHAVKESRESILATLQEEGQGDGTLEDSLGFEPHEKPKLVEDEPADD